VRIEAPHPGDFVIKKNTLSFFSYIFPGLQPTCRLNLYKKRSAKNPRPPQRRQNFETIISSGAFDSVERRLRHAVRLPSKFMATSIDLGRVKAKRAAGESPAFSLNVSRNCFDRLNYADIPERGDSFRRAHSFAETPFSASCGFRLINTSFLKPFSLKSGRGLKAFTNFAD
jgi:hypothetical protein